MSSLRESYYGFFKTYKSFRSKFAEKIFQFFQTGTHLKTRIYGNSHISTIAAYTKDPIRQNGISLAYKFLSRWEYLSYGNNSKLFYSDLRKYANTISIGKSDKTPASTSLAAIVTGNIGTCIELENLETKQNSRCNEQNPFEIRILTNVSTTLVNGRDYIVKTSTDKPSVGLTSTAQSGTILRKADSPDSIDVLPDSIGISALRTGSLDRLGNVTGDKYNIIDPSNKSLSKHISGNKSGTSFHSSNAMQRDRGCCIPGSGSSSSSGSKGSSSSGSKDNSTSGLKDSSSSGSKGNSCLESKGNASLQSKGNYCSRSKGNSSSSGVNGDGGGDDYKKCDAGFGCPLGKASHPAGEKAKHKYELESAVNRQILTELNAGYAYMSMANYFGNVRVNLPGLAKFYWTMFEEEVGHAKLLMNYQNLRGASVKLCPITPPEIEDWGCVTRVLEISLEMEKLVKDKLCELNELADKNKDLSLSDFIVTTFMKEQDESIHEFASLLVTACKFGTCKISEHLFDQYISDNYLKKCKK